MYEHLGNPENYVVELPKAQVAEVKANRLKLYCYGVASVVGSIAVLVAAIRF